jgi:hypothetical protein
VKSQELADTSHGLEARLEWPPFLGMAVVEAADERSTRLRPRLVAGACSRSFRGLLERGAWLLEGSLADDDVQTMAACRPDLVLRQRNAAEQRAVAAQATRAAKAGEIERANRHAA